MPKSVTKPVFVLCDAEADYTFAFSDYLKSVEEFPWTLKSYTSAENLLVAEEKQKITLLLVSESTYTEEMRELQAKKLVILGENGLLHLEGVPVIDKYQPADLVAQCILSHFMEVAGVSIPGKFSGSSKTKVIGLFSPVHRTLQSTFSLTLCTLLGRNHKVLYLNFEHYFGVEELQPDLHCKDLADLLYYLSEDKSTFSLRFHMILQKINRFDYVPPMRAGQNLLSITEREWLDLIQKIRDLDEYDYLILDLSESIQGLYDILRGCDTVYTMIRNDRAAKMKMSRYEQLLVWYDYKDVVAKTCTCALPRFQHVPETLEQYSKGDLAEYVEKLIDEMEK